MAPRGLGDDKPAGPTGRFADDLIGLDPQDPEAQAFAAHLDRIERPNSKPTVEGMLASVDDFAQCANRTDGHRRVVVVTMVSLMLTGVGFALWNSLGFTVGTLFG